MKCLILAVPMLLVSGCRRGELREVGTHAKDASPIESAVEKKHVQRSATFDVASVALSIEDAHMSTKLDELLASTQGALVVNAGFFDPRGEPLGLAVSHGKSLSAFSRSMSGGIVWVRDGVAHLTASEDYDPSLTVDFAVQCRPRLVVGSRPNVQRDDGKRAPRTAICLRQGGLRIEVVMAGGDYADDGPTLYELARELTARGCEEALNLDGGPSTGWASREDGGVVFSPPRGPVRQAIVIRDGR